MGNWYVINDFGRVVAGPYLSKEVAQTFAHAHPMLNVIYREDN